MPDEGPSLVVVKASLELLDITDFTVGSRPGAQMQPPPPQYYPPAPFVQDSQPASQPVAHEERQGMEE